MTVFLANILVDSEKNFENFRISLADIDGIFSESYVMFRGKYGSKCLEFFQENFNGEIHNYQHLNDKDWMRNTMDMLKDIKQRSVFFYLEDHRIVGPIESFKKITKEFDAHSLDYLSYSYFDSGGLSTNNLLPLNPKYFDKFDTFELTKNNKRLLNSITPNYFGFSILSITSIKFLKFILRDAYSRKFSSKYLSILFTIIFPFPKYRKVVDFINTLLRKINITYHLYPINSPHNIEKLINEFHETEENWHVGVLHEELFADSDDDNGVYGSSLMKRSLYPFSNSIDITNTQNFIEFEKKFLKGEERYFKYFSQIHRIYNAPILELQVEDGGIELNYQSEKILLNSGNRYSIHINKGVLLKSLSESKIKFKVYDEVF